MPIVPGFTYDLFVSYAHLDDTPFNPADPGWVGEFLRLLEIELKRRNRNFTMWFDPQLRTADNYNLAIAKAISESAVFLSILSPAYADCPYCKKEINEFREQRHPAFGMTVGTLSRMQGLVLEAIPEDRWPPELRSTSPYRFCSETVSRFSKPKTEDDTHPYEQGLWKVRDSIWAVLEEMRRKKEGGTVVERSYEIQNSRSGVTPSVYLADVTDDLFDKRESLRSALEQLKEFQVCTLTDTAVPAGLAMLFVHLFGKFPGRPAAGQDVSLSRAQLQAVLASNPARRPLVWLGRELKPEEAESPSHKQFLDSLLNHNGIELLRTGFEDLKGEIAKRMRPETNPTIRTLRRHRGDHIIHIWHETDDSARLVPIKRYLNANQCGISVFAYSSVPLEELQSKLDCCDGLVVSYTAETKAHAEDALTKAFYARRRDELPIAYAALGLPPPSEVGFNFEHPRVVPVHATPDGQLAGMDDFLAKLEERDD